MNIITGPRGVEMLVDSHRGIPLIWFQVAILGGCVDDPPECEGFTNHMVSLARRGAGSRDRRVLDEELDRLGASLSISADRDSIKMSGVCLTRHIDRVIELAADLLAAPHMAEHEHDKLLREARMALDELRDDDSQLATRFFNRSCVPGHPYARTMLGTERSLSRIDLAQVKAVYRQRIVPQNLLIGMAGDLDTARAENLAARLVAALPDQPAPPQLSLASPPRPRGRRILVVDKPERTQAQILVGHLGPRYGSPDSLPMMLVDTAFGGMFTSRLMQEIRVKRGWSYGAGSSLSRSRGEGWFRIHLAPAAEVAPDALALTWSMLADLASQGLSADELTFAQGYLTGSLPFRLATAKNRVRVAVQSRIFGLSTDFVDTLPARLSQLTLADIQAVAQRWLFPDDHLSVMVATADTMVPRLESISDAEITVIPYDSY